MANDASPHDLPPSGPRALGDWFREAVETEVEALEKTGSSQKYELISGEYVQQHAEDSAIFRFIVADGTRLPEEAAGLLETGGERLSASIIAQDANRVHVLIQGQRPTPQHISQALLVIDDTALLHRLAEVLEEGGLLSERLAVAAFHPSRAKVGFEDLSNIPQLDAVTGEHRRTLEQCLGSDVTYIWGPPGTGKTFGIAHLIAGLIENGRRVLITSHTHAAVDAALYEALIGPLSHHPHIDAGKVLRVGHSADPKIPDAVRLRQVAEDRAADISAQISKLELSAAPLIEERGHLKAQLAEWERSTELENRITRLHNEADAQAQAATEADTAVRSAQDELDSARAALERAQRAWIRRSTRTRNAAMDLEDSEERLRNVERARESANRSLDVSLRRASELEEQLRQQQRRCEGLPKPHELTPRIGALDSELGNTEQAIRQLQERLGVIEQELIDGAAVIGCTLTKLYVGHELVGQTFDVVIVDEISMALPPLVFIAAGRATSHLILAGDFLQLPPIVRSDEDISDYRLGQDVFRLARLVGGREPVPGKTSLAKLTTQRRMVPPIADLARHLAYGPDGIRDHISVQDRETPEWCTFLPDSPLVIVDTADMKTWSGKQPGSLSRFNFYTATLAAEIAAMAAAGIPQPDVGERPPIGIVTPYAAQRRLLGRLVESLGLFGWVASGTVHTFQGSQADLIIFDSVLDEPYYSAALCTPSYLEDVIRQLNVAVTRARDKLLFIGSSEWLNRNARPDSGLGQLWAFLRDRATPVRSYDLVGMDFAERVTSASLVGGSWLMPERDGEAVHEILDEQTFFDRFIYDISEATDSVFGLVPYFGEYRWPRIQPSFMAALARGVEVTLVTPSLAEVSNRSFVERAIDNLRSAGAVVVTGEGLHGKDVVVDGRIHYTGSLNWASHRGRSEIMHRTVGNAHAGLVLQYLQARHIRTAAAHEDGSPRLCPECGGPTQVVNQRRQHFFWDRQAMKVGCANPDCRSYLRDIDERPPFREVPRCQVDGATDYRRVTRGRGERWQCPNHPRQCVGYKAVPGDPE